MANLVLGAGGAAAEDYTVDQSLRFNSDDSAYLSKTFASAGDRNQWTFSYWLKRGTFPYSGNDPCVLNAGEGRIGIDRNDNLWVRDYDGSQKPNLKTSQLFRDPASWYHVVVAMDTTQGTPADRTKIYVNGSQVTAFGTETYPDENQDTTINNNVEHLIGKNSGDNGAFDGYLAEVYFIDGQTLDADDFGETDEDTNQWKPKDASGLTFGTNGFYLKFEDSADLGNDSSGEGNDFTVTNLDADDQFLDTPTNNFPTLNPLNIPTSRGPTISEVNLKTTIPTLAGPGPYFGGNSTMALPSSGKWYYEALNMAYGAACIGITSNQTKMADENNGPSSDGYCYYRGGSLEGHTSAPGTWDSYTTDDIIGIAVDLDDDRLYVAKNNTWQDSADPTDGTNAVDISFPSDSNELWTFSIGTAGAADSPVFANFGQDSSFGGNETAQGNQDGNGIGDFYYEPPSGYLALCTSNLPDPDIKKSTTNFNTLIWSGDDATPRAMTGLGLAPDMVWIKQRDGTEQACIYDDVRGATKFLAPSADTVEGTLTEGLTSFDSDGWTMGDDTANNGSGKTYVAWNWNAGGSTVTNTTGDIDTEVRASTTAGVSIMTYTGTGTAGDTIGHGLSEAPTLVITKQRGGTGSWQVGSNELQSGAWTKYLTLETSDAVGTAIQAWNDTAPSASVITLGTGGSCNSSTDTFVSYAFHSVEGYSKVGSYLGNGNANGPFIYCGFRPAFFMMKRTNSANDWIMFDSARIGYNVENYQLYPNTTAVEDTTDMLDFDSNGVKIIGTGNNINNSTSTYLFYAVAEYPFKYAPAR